MKDHPLYLASFLFVLTLCLSACAGAPTASVAGAQPAQKAAAPAGAPELTLAPVPTATESISAVEKFLDAYLAGESINVSSLSPAEFREFSTQLAEQRNAERGVNPVIYNGEAYISPDNYMMMDYDGYPDQNETIKMYLPIAGKDSDGNLLIVNHDGEIVTIENSADVDWNMRVTDPNDPRIDWPNLPNDIDGGLDEITYRLSDHPRNINKTFVVPAILLDKTMGQIFMEGRGKGFIPLFRFITVADTDVNGVPILFRLSLMIPNTTQLAIEGSDFWTKAHGVSVLDHDMFYINLQENSVYYMGIHQDQDAVWDKNFNTTMDAYQGLMTNNEITSILTHQAENTQDMMLLPPSLLIQKK